MFRGRVWVGVGRLEDVATACFDCTVFTAARACGAETGRLGAAAFGSASLFVAALGLLEERGEDARESDDESEHEEADGHGAPESNVAGGTGLLGDVGEGQDEGEDGEEEEGCGEDVEVASHVLIQFTGNAAAAGDLDWMDPWIFLNARTKLLSRK